MSALDMDAHSWNRQYCIGIPLVFQDIKQIPVPCLEQILVRVVVEDFEIRGFWTMC